MLAVLKEEPERQDVQEMRDDGRPDVFSPALTALGRLCHHRVAGECRDQREARVVQPTLKIGARRETAEHSGLAVLGPWMVIWLPAAAAAHQHIFACTFL